MNRWTERHGLIFARMQCRGIGEREGRRRDLWEELGSRQDLEVDVAAGQTICTMIETRLVP